MRKYLILFAFLIACAVQGQNASDFLQASFQQSGPSCVDPFPGNPNPQIFVNHALAYCDDEVNSLVPSGTGNNQLNENGATQTNIATTGNDHGDYAIRATATDAVNGRNQVYATLVVGEVYQWAVAYRIESGASQRRYKFQTGNPDTSSYGFTNTVWNYASGEFTADGTTMQFRMYATSDTGGNIGDEVDWKFYMKLKND